MKVVSLWSGGKDSCFACYKAIQKGYDVISLFNFTDSKKEKSLSHGLLCDVIRKQADLTAISLFQKAMKRETYREEFIKLINEWKAKENIEGIVFGDIYLQEHKDWIDEVCREMKVEAVMPLWGKNTEDLLKEFIDSGFKAVIVAVKEEYKDLLGKDINSELISELRERKVDFCGEEGEFHTLVYDGPLFKKQLNVVKGRKFLENGRWFLELNIR